MQEVDIKETVKQGDDSEIDDDIEKEVCKNIFPGFTNQISVDILDLKQR